MIPATFNKVLETVFHCLQLVVRCTVAGPSAAYYLSPFSSTCRTILATIGLPLTFEDHSGQTLPSSHCQRHVSFDPLLDTFLRCFVSLPRSQKAVC